MSAVAPLFNLAVIAPSSGSSDNAIKTVQRAYYTVFGRDVPAMDRDNHLVHWTQVCSSPGVPDSIVQELRQILPSLPDLTWKNAAPMVGLDPSRGEEQLSRKRMQILYFPDKFVDEIMDIARWRNFWSERRQYVQLGSFVSVVAPQHCPLLTSEVKAVKMVLNKIGFGYEKVQSESSFNLEVKIVHNAALLMFESELWHDQSQVLAQAITEVTCLAASNSRLGYSFPIHIVITDLYQTSFYTYYPSAKKIYLRRRFHVGEECDVGGDPWEIRESLLLVMTPVLARDLFCLLMEGYHDYVQAKISLCPDTERKGSERALELIDEARTLMSNRNGTQEEGESDLKKLSTSTLVLPWGHKVFTEEEMRAQDKEIHRMLDNQKNEAAASMGL
ncbi:uncharacterized protein ARMOST_12242 [Armillaria ostoyae]|uniref:Uncharacterized protein n=1 Tax=Armillaria ostoyae TaxID=47428 RepID=A0A284RJE6_ARMOS|nr:uncharacterized protein ARMOST_12242 [Armillaria ostoyae]